jgi:hypothetical protein
MWCTPASIYTTGALGMAIGSYLFPTLLASSIYEAHTPPGSTECVGRECYFASFLVCAVLIGFSGLMSLWLTRVSRARYAELYPVAKSVQAREF